jgi:dihydrofolate synthase/folylpolyglutamate synthase
MDHTDILGDTIEKIAREKAGIIKPNTPVVTGIIPDAALFEIKRRAELLNATVIPTVDEESPQEVVHETQTTGRVTLAAQLNGRIARRIINCLIDQIPVSSDAISDGFKLWSVRYPSGVSFRKVDSDYPWYYDGAHNPEAIKLLKLQLSELSPLYTWTLVLSLMRDKLSAELVSELSEFGSVIYYPLKLSRAATEKEVKELMPEISILDAEDSLPESWVQKNKSELVIFGGSFYFYKTLMQWMENIADH